MTKTFQFPKVERENFLKEFNRLNKKLQKYNSSMTILSQREFVYTVTRDNWFSKSFDKIEIPSLSYEIELPTDRGKQGVKFLGMASYENEIPTIFSVEDTSNLNQYLRGQKDVCDHCNSLRKRTKWFYFEEARQVKRIGSSCVFEWFGLNLEAVLGKFFDLFYKFSEYEDLDSSSIEEQEFNQRFFRVDPFIPLKSLIISTAIATESFRGSWTSRSKADENGLTSTSELIEDYLKATEFTDSFKKLVDFTTTNLENYLEKIKTFWQKTPSNDFEFNVFQQLFDSNNNLRESVLYSKRALVEFAIWKANSFSEASLKEEKKQISSEYLGLVGQRIEISGHMKMVGTYRTFIRYEELTGRIYQITTPVGIAKWFTLKNIEFDAAEGSEDFHNTYNNLTNSGFEVTLKGTIKDLSEYKGIKETILTRCKVSLK